MKIVTVIGAEGFVGSAFAAHLSSLPGVSLRPVTRRNYAQEAGRPSDVVIDCAANSRKYLAEERPVEEFSLSVAHRLQTILDFPAGLQLHVSSVDVYSVLDSPATTVEDAPVDLARLSHYGFHKRLAEEVVQHYAPRWLIVRLAGMVGPALRKNPVYDVLQGQPLRIHPDSRYQFMETRDVARIAWTLVDRGLVNEVFNVCAEGLVSPREIARLAGRELDLSLLLGPEAAPRIVHASTAKLEAILPVPKTTDAVTAFVGGGRTGSPERATES